jgi:hypothetical protein
MQGPSQTDLPAQRPSSDAATGGLRLATGRYDALAGRYLHAEHDSVDELLDRIDEVRERDLNAIRLRR